jgi:hypothetical protein
MPQETHFYDNPFKGPFPRAFLRPFSIPRLRHYICKAQIREITEDGNTDQSAFSRQKRTQWKRPYRLNRAILLAMPTPPNPVHE